MKFIKTATSLLLTTLLSTSCAVDVPKEKQEEDKTKTQSQSPTEDTTIKKIEGQLLIKVKSNFEIDDQSYDNTSFAMLFTDRQTEVAKQDGIILSTGLDDDQYLKIEDDQVIVFKDKFPKEFYEDFNVTIESDGPNQSALGGELGNYTETKLQPGRYYITLEKNVDLSIKRGKKTVRSLCGNIKQTLSRNLNFESDQEDVEVVIESVDFDQFELTIYDKDCKGNQVDIKPTTPTPTPTPTVVKELQQDQ